MKLKINNIKKYPFMILFITTILTFTVLDIFNKDILFSEYENRSLAQKPKLYYSALIDGRFFDNYDRYINDQFIFRNSWINMKSFSENMLGKEENNNIIYGENNFLFDKFQEIDEENLNRNVDIIKEFISKYNSSFNLMIIPESFTIYKDLLPYGVNLIDEKSYINNIYSEFSNLKNVKSINILDTLNKNKESYIYYKTDHHWTSYGAYLAYLEYCNLNNITPINITELKENNVPNFYGTYFSKSKKFNSESDTISYYDLDNVDVFINGEKFSNINDNDKWSSSDKYSAFLRGNNALTLIKNNNISNDSKILLIKDSYANSFVQFIANNYNETYIVDLRSFSNDFNSFFKSNNFNDVIIIYSLKNLSEDLNIAKLKY